MSITNSYEGESQVISTPRNLSHKKVIRNYWAIKLVEMGKFDSVEEVMEEDYCWGCGFYDNKPTDRAHIRARSYGGCDKAHNLHLLCRECHKASEFLTGEDYDSWFANRNLIHKILENTPGAILANLLKKENNA
jgi:5-methylcytosine-specific restriction endonuclease McrA